MATLPHLPTLEYQSPGVSVADLSKANEMVTAASDSLVAVLKVSGDGLALLIKSLAINVLFAWVPLIALQLIFDVFVTIEIDMDLFIMLTYVFGGIMGVGGSAQAVGNYLCASRTIWAIGQRTICEYCSQTGIVPGTKECTGELKDVNAIEVCTNPFFFGTVQAACVSLGFPQGHVLANAGAIYSSSGSGRHHHTHMVQANNKLSMYVADTDKVYALLQRLHVTVNAAPPPHQNLPTPPSYSAAQAPPGMGASFCTQCGATLLEGTKFCPSCGNPVG